MPTDHLSTPCGFFFHLENNFNCNSQGFQQPHFTLNLKINYFNTPERECNFQLKCGNLHYLNLIKRALLTTSWTKAKGSTFPWLQAFKRCSQYKHITMDMMFKTEKSSEWFWGRRVFNLVHFTSSWPLYA